MEEGEPMETPVSFAEMGMTFTPGAIIRMADGVATYKLGEDSQLAVEFYEKRIPILSKSTEQAIHFDKVDYVRITRPGDKCVVERKARVADKHRFPEQWYRYKSGVSQTVGTPVQMLYQQGLVTQAQVEMLGVAKVFTVEQLASASELVVDGFGPDGATLKKLARGYLNFYAHIEGKKEFKELQDSLEKQKKELTDGLEELRNERAALKAEREALLEIRSVVPAAPKKKGWPKGVKRAFPSNASAREVNEILGADTKSESEPEVESGAEG